MKSVSFKIGKGRVIFKFSFVIGKAKKTRVKKEKVVVAESENK